MKLLKLNSVLESHTSNAYWGKVTVDVTFEFPAGDPQQVVQEILNMVSAWAQSKRCETQKSGELK